MNPTQQKILRGDVLKALYYQNAFSDQTTVGSLTLWTVICEAGHHEGGEKLSRSTLEKFVDALVKKDLVKKILPTELGGMLTDYNVRLTRKGTGMLKRAIELDPDIILGEV